LNGSGYDYGVIVMNCFISVIM